MASISLRKKVIFKSMSLLNYLIFIISIYCLLSEQGYLIFMQWSYVFQVDVIRARFIYYRSLVF